MFLAASRARGCAVRLLDLGFGGVDCLGVELVEFVDVELALPLELLLELSAPELPPVLDGAGLLATGFVSTVVSAGAVVIG